MRSGLGWAECALDVLAAVEDAEDDDYLLLNLERDDGVTSQMRESQTGHDVIAFVSALRECVEAVADITT